MGTQSDYEDIRKARILENQVRLASLGLEKSVAELRAIVSSSSSTKPLSSTPPPRKYIKIVYDSASLRRSNRLKGSDIEVKSEPLRRSSRLKGNPQSGERGSLEPTRRSLFGKAGDIEGKKRRANAASLIVDESERQRRLGSLGRRCDSKSRGSVYDPVFGICCHFCRQKKLCGEEDCKRCGNLDIDQPCIGKTECSVCHSGYGVLCRACLKVRYGQEMEEVRENKEWMCPHCIEDKGINPYWICNSSLCLKKRKMAPTGIAIFKAREMGYASVAHFIMDELKQAGKRR